MTNARVYYFGCWSKTDRGHCLYRPNRSTPRAPDDVPVRLGQHHLDGTYCPQNIDQKLGPALLHHVHGWTVLAFWDRSADTRPGSNSAFLAEGARDFDAMCGFAAQHFPEQWARISEAFQLWLVDMLVIDGPDRAHVEGCMDAVSARISDLALEGWEVMSLLLGEHLWRELRKRRVEVTGLAALASLSEIKVERDVRLRGDMLCACLRRRPSFDEAVQFANRISALLGDVEGSR